LAGQGRKSETGRQEFGNPPVTPIGKI
jgi:hypothetical protein